MSTIKNIEKTVVTIGDGIAAWCLHEQLTEAGFKNIINISANDVFTPCTLNSTSINCLRGTQKGMSPLGDLIVDTYDEFLKFYQEENPDGVAPGIEFALWSEEQADKWERRYPEFSISTNDQFLKPLVCGEFRYVPNEAYFIDSNKLGAWFRKRHSQKGITWKTDLVTCLERNKENNKIQVWCGKNFVLADEVYLCTSRATQIIGKGFDEKFDYYIDHCKPVAGTFLEISANHFKFEAQESFNLAFGSHHFIFRKEEGIVQIGSTSDNNCDVEMGNMEGILKIYQSVKAKVNFELPDFEKFTVKTGIRHKGHKRMPFIGEVSQGVHAVCGLYKNAYTFAFQKNTSI